MLLIGEGTTAGHATPADRCNGIRRRGARALLEVQAGAELSAFGVADGERGSFQRFSISLSTEVWS